MPITDYKIEFRLPSEEEKKVTIEGLRQHDIASGGVATKEKPFSILARSQSNLIASLIGKTFRNWLYIEWLWVSAETRKSGLGSQLIRQAEQKARDMNLTGIYCWTESWEAPEFYKKLGYEQFTVFTDFPPKHKRYGFRKYL